MIVASPPPAAPPQALCLDCNYSLRGLADHRCPECGRAFDPADTWTMNMGRPCGAVVRSMLSPVGRPTVVLAALATVATFWWTTYLPGAWWAMLISLGLWMMVYIYRGTRLLLRRLLARLYRQRIRPKRRSIFLILILLTGLLIWTRLPARLIFLAHRSSIDRLVQHYYAEVPVGTVAPVPQRIGLY